MRGLEDDDDLSITPPSYDSDIDASDLENNSDLGVMKEPLSPETRGVRRLRLNTPPSVSGSINNPYFSQIGNCSTSYLPAPQFINRKNSDSPCFK